FVLFPRDPRRPSGAPPEPAGKPIFHGHRILGQTVIADPSVRSRLLTAFYDNVGRSDPGRCFNPRHGIRAVRDGKTVDLLICFECWRVVVYDSRGEHDTTISRIPQPVFDRVLTAARIPLAKR